MKLIEYRPDDEPLTHIKRKVAAEELRGMRMANTRRSILCYAWLGITAATILIVLGIVVLQGLAILALPSPVVIALIGGTVANASVLLNTIFKGEFSRKA